MWLKKKRYRDLGIETYPDCFGVGTASTVLHIFETRRPFHKAPLDFYIVGASLDVLDKDTRMNACFAIQDGKRTLQATSGRRVYLYKTMTSARAKYEALCKAARAELAANIAKRNAIAAKARAGDLGAALELGLDW